MSSNISTRSCLWKKVMLNPASTSSADANPIQKQRCQNCQCNTQDPGCFCDKYIKDTT